MYHIVMKTTFLASTCLVCGPILLNFVQATCIIYIYQATTNIGPTPRLHQLRFCIYLVHVAVLYLGEPTRPRFYLARTATRSGVATVGGSTLGST